MYQYNEDEINEVQEKYFQKVNQLSLIRLPKKLKQKYLCMVIIQSLFDSKQVYTEKQVNEILKPVYMDYVMLRRFLIDFNLLNRENDGSKYWID
mgnify:CR=1 FL=1